MTEYDHPMRLVREAIKERVQPGDELVTPAQRASFRVETIGPTKVQFRVGRAGVSRIAVELDVLDRLPAYLAKHDGVVPIGAIKGGAAPKTLEWFLQSEHLDGTMRGSYVAPLLVRTGVCAYSRQGSGAMWVQLQPGW